MDSSDSAVRSETGKLTKRIEELEREVREWREKREALNNQVIELAKKRNALNDSVREAIKIARENREIRDRLNEEINVYKSEKNAIQDQGKELSSKLDEVEKSIDELPDEAMKPKKGISSSRLRKQIQELEWKIQTTSNLPLEEERALVDRVSELEDQLSQQQETDDIFKERRATLSKLRSLRSQQRAIISKLGKAIAESRAAHKKMIEMYKEANKLRKEADSHHREIQQIKGEADSVHQQYVERIRQKKRLDAQMRAMKAEKVATKEQLIDERAEKAKTAVKEGKKISFDEFKAMIDRGLI
ncbi:MAG: coiled-coil protein [Candidatus Odinarchaeota archaeon]